MTLTDTIARIRAEAGDGPLLPVPPPTVSDLVVGWSVHETADPSTWYDVRGGVIVHVTPNGAHSPETGEALDRYTVVDVDKGKLCWHSLRADQLAAVDDSCRPNASTIRGVCQVAARELVSGARSRKPDDERALELWSLGCRLMSVLARPGTVAP